MLMLWNTGCVVIIFQPLLFTVIGHNRLVWCTAPLFIFCGQGICTHVFSFFFCKGGITLAEWLSNICFFLFAHCLGEQLYNVFVYDEDVQFTKP